MTNFAQVWMDYATGTVQQMQQWPAAILLVAVLCVIGMLLKHLSPFPNKYIPFVILLSGAVGNAMLGDPGSVSPTQRHPIVILALQGVLLGFASWASHKLVIARIEKYLPFNDDVDGEDQNNKTKQ